MNSKLLEITKKHPALRKYAEDQIINYPENLVYSFIEIYLKYKNILRGKIEFKENVEVLHDLATYILKREQVQKFIKDNIKKNMIDYIDNTTYEMIEEIYYSFDDKKWLAKDMFSSVSSCNTENDLKVYIKQYYNNSIHFSLQVIKDKINNEDSSIYVEDGNILIIEIKNYKGITELGSNKWCISNYNDYYDYYTEDLKRQFIIYDFNKVSYDNRSMIGITISYRGKIISAFDKNNNDVVESQSIHDHYFPKLSKKDIIEMIKYRGIVSVVSEVALLDMDEIAIEILAEREIDMSDIVEIVRKISIFGDTKTLYSIIKTYVDFYSKTEYLKLFSSYGATKAFTIICNKIDLSSENIEKSLWESAYYLASNQEDKEVEIVIKKIAQIKNKNINKIAEFVELISVHSDFCNYFNILLVNIQDVDWSLIKFDIKGLIFYVVPANQWEIILKGKVDVNFDSIELFLNDVKDNVFPSELINFNNNKKEIYKILKRKLA